MTGRRLYDHYTDASAACINHFVSGVGWVGSEELPAWPFLADKERNMWNSLARRIEGTR